MISTDTIVLLIPINDPESLTIRAIAEKLKIPTLISNQPHGAKLDKEENLIARAKEVNPDADRIVIIEIPDPKTEKELEDQGLKVVIIDHHRYGELDRTNDISSLEQFLAYFEISNEELEKHGFDSLMIQIVAAMDRGFVWAVKEMNLNPEDEKRGLDYYHALLLELGGDKRKEEEAQAKKAFAEREGRGNFVFVENANPEIGIRDALSFEMAHHFGKPTTLLLKQGHILYVQETDKALDLLKRFGGFTYGGDTCWGIWQKEGEDIVDDVMRMLEIE